MKRIVMLALVILIGSYGAAQAQVSEAEATARERAAQEAAARQVAAMEEAKEMEEATTEFLGLEWGAGVGVMGSFGGDDAIEKASIVNGQVQVDEEGDMRPQLFLEMHVLLAGGKGKVRKWRDYQQKKAEYQMETAMGVSAERLASSDYDSPPLWGFGPFIALQSSNDSAIDALALGGMWGFRKSPDATTSVNVGVGVSFDPSVQVLAKGFHEGGSPPNNETEVRFKKEGRFGWVLMTSFTF